MTNDAFEFLKARQILIDIFDDAVIQSLHIVDGDQLRTRGERRSGWLRAQSSSSGKYGAISTAGNLRLSPSTTASAIKALCFSEFSIGWGAMNLPPEVLIRSFLRSVTERKPSASRLPMSPVLNHPSTKALSVSSGRFQ